MARDNHELITPSPAIFAGADKLAVGSGDAVALAGRLLIGWLFIAGVWPPKILSITGFVGYLTFLKIPSPVFWAYVGAYVEFAIAVALLLGVATRYASLCAIVFVLVATALAHRYWERPAAQQLGDYINFVKNFALVGGLLLLFVTGAGRFSVDGWLRRKG